MTMDLFMDNSVEQMISPPDSDSIRQVTVSREKRGEERVLSEELMSGISKLTIEHADQDYILRVTKAGKLILTK